MTTQSVAVSVMGEPEVYALDVAERIVKRAADVAHLRQPCRRRRPDC